MGDYQDFRSWVSVTACSGILGHGKNRTQRGRLQWAVRLTTMAAVYYPWGRLSSPDTARGFQARSSDRLDV